MDVAGLFLDLSDGVFGRTWRRLAGLTDEELLWEPAPDCWTVRERADGEVRADWAPYIGDAEVTASGLIRSTRTGGDAAHPPPFTTLAWRIAHLTEVYGRAQNELWLTGRTTVDGDVERPAQRSAAGALGGLSAAHSRWRAVLASLVDRQLDEPISARKRHAGTTKAGYVLAMIDEFAHHGAELGVLRDLYAHLHAPHPLRESPPNLAQVAWAGMWHAIPALIEAGADVNAESGGVSALHLAAAAGEREIVELLLEHGASTLAVGHANFFRGGTPLQWAEHFGRANVAAMLRAQGSSTP